MAEDIQQHWQGPKRRELSVLCAWVLLCPTMSFAILAESPMLGLAAAFFLLLSVLVRRPVSSSTRSWIYAATVALIFVTVLELANPINDEHFFLPAALIFPFVLTVGVFACFFVQTPPTITVIVGLSLLAMMTQGSSLKNPDIQRLGLAGDLWGNRFWVFGVFLSAQMLGLLPLLSRIERGQALPSSPPVRRWRRRAVFLLSSVAFVGLTIGLCLLARKSYHRLDVLLGPMLERAIFGRPAVYQAFGPRIDLYQTPPLKEGRRSRGIVLQVRSSIPPGYLRGRAYVHYLGGGWTEAEGADELPALALDSGLSTEVFAKLDASGREELLAMPAIEVFPTRHYGSDLPLVSGNFAAIELIADRMAIGADGTLHPKEWEKLGGYTLRAAKIDQAAVFPAPAEAGEPYWETYLQVPEEIRPALERLARQMLGERPSPTAAIRRIPDYLRNHYRYALGVDMGAPQDPVLQFLEETKAGHCELFASAAAMLLRTQGVPTRYLTGFVCFESGRRSGYWVARRADSHAWVEAFNRDLGEWQWVEATPAAAIPAPSPAAAGLAALWEYPLMLLRAPLAYVKRGLFAQAVIAIAGEIGTFLAWLFWRGPWFVGWALVVAAAWAALAWRRRRRPRWAATHAHAKRLRRCLGLVERYLRRYQVRRTAAMSIRDLWQQVGRGQVPLASHVQDLLTEYETLRYDPGRCTEAAVLALADRVRNELRRAPGASSASSPKGGAPR